MLRLLVTLKLCFAICPLRWNETLYLWKLYGLWWKFALWNWIYILIENFDFRNSLSLKSHREGFQKFVDFGSKFHWVEWTVKTFQLEVFKIIYYLLKYTNCEVKVSRANKPINCSSAVPCLIFYNGLWFCHTIQQFFDVKFSHNSL